MKGPKTTRLLFSNAMVQYLRAGGTGTATATAQHAYSQLSATVVSSSTQPGAAESAIKAMESNPTAPDAVERLASVVELRTDALQTILEQILQLLSTGLPAGQSEDLIREARLARYMEWVRERHQGLRTNDIVVGQTSTDTSPLQLEQVFVALDTTLSIPKDLTLHNWLDRRREERGDGQEELKGKGSRPVPVFEAMVEHPMLVLLGDPGSGKSTVGQFVAFALAARARGDSACFDKLGVEAAVAPGIPIPIVLRHFAAWLELQGSPQSKPQLLWDYLRSELEGDGLPDGVVDAVKDSEVHGYWFLLDGWDETDTPLKLAMVAETITGLVRIYEGKARCRFLLASRFYAWDEVQESMLGRQDSKLALTDGPLALRFQRALENLGRAFPNRYDVAKLDGLKIEAFTKLWYEAVQSGDKPWMSAKDAAIKRDNLQSAAQREDLEPVVSNPLLLTLTASLSGSRLPDDRADLFDQVVTLLLDRWTIDRGQPGLMQRLGVNVPMAAIREKIEECAFRAHVGHVGSSGLVDIPEGAIRDAIETLVGGDANKAKEVVAFLHERAGLLVSRGRKSGAAQFACPHRSLQEFLAGCYLGSQPTFYSEEPVLNPDEEPSALTLARAHAGHWKEVLAFAARKAGYNTGSLAAFTLVQSRSFDGVTDGSVDPCDWELACVAGHMLCEIGVVRLQSKAPKRRKDDVASWLAALVEGGHLGSPKERNKAAEMLAKLGDPRQGVMPPWPPSPEKPMFAWTDQIGAVASFKLGGDALAWNLGGKRGPSWDAALPQPFHLARYLVTNAQYDHFEASDFFRESRADGVILKPRSRERSQFLTANHPVVDVRWHDAMAFCEWMDRWLNPVSGGPPDPERWKAMGLPGEPPPGTRWRIRLPSEEQWEFSARGAEGRWVPWQPRAPGGAPSMEIGTGELGERCNCQYARIGSTSAVGLFPASQPEGWPMDMIGNVWEWTRSRATTVPTLTEEGADVSSHSKEPRVLRGGSWGLDDPEDLRCATRLGSVPGRSVGIIGFRVVCVRVSASGG